MTDTTKNKTIIPQQLVEQLDMSLRNIHGWGSIEIFIQNYKVTQVIEKNICKPSINILAESEVLIQE